VSLKCAEHPPYASCCTGSGHERAGKACGDGDVAGVDARGGSCRLPKEATSHGQSEEGTDGGGTAGPYEVHLAIHRTCAHLPRRARRARRRGGSLSRERPAAHGVSGGEGRGIVLGDHETAARVVKYRVQTVLRPKEGVSLGRCQGKGHGHTLYFTYLIALANGRLSTVPTLQAMCITVTSGCVRPLRASALSEQVPCLCSLSIAPRLSLSAVLLMTAECCGDAPFLDG
jgi:hypothetical protein